MNTDFSELKEMLSYKRPMGSASEAEYRERFLMPLGLEKDPFGNLYKIIGDKPTIMWSSHTDSVHNSSGRQRVDFEGGFIKLHKKSKSSCLGADDAAGNWIMMHMIHASVPGLYVFHFGEERGCHGSRDILQKAPEFIAGIQAAIAFDRRGTDSVITHQGGRTCSDAFGSSLAAQLEGYKLDPTGVLTDTRIYKGVIPECTNLSVGYYSEHTSREQLDFDHIVSLRDQMLKIDASKFVIERDPKAVESFGSYGSSMLGGAKTNHGDPKDIYELVWRYPEDVTEVLETSGVDFDEFKALVLEARDVRREGMFGKKRKSAAADATAASDDAQQFKKSA